VYLSLTHSTLAVRFFLLTLIITIEEVIRVVPNYYAQRVPAELGWFDWIVDPKDVRPTRYEEVWQQIVSPILQRPSLEEPAARIREWDYSAFNRFDMKTPDYLLPYVRKDLPGGWSTWPQLRAAHA
jgi:hypothetical protein